MSGNEIFKPHNVAAWALEEKQRPFPRVSGVPMHMINHPYRIARSARYSSPMDSKSPPRLFRVLSTMNAFSANSRPVMSLAICSFPLSPSGHAIEMCNTNVRIT